MADAEIEKGGGMYPPYFTSYTGKGDLLKF